MLKQLTENEKKVLRFIYEDGRPTYREIADAVGLADVTSAVYVVNALIKKGLLAKDKRRTSRALKITKEGYLQLQNVFVGDLKKWLDKEKAKISFPEEFRVNGVATPQQLNTSYWRAMGADSTELQGVPEDIKTAVNFLLAHPSINGTAKNIFDSEKMKSVASLLYSTEVLPVFCWAVIFSLVILPASPFFLKEKLNHGFYNGFRVRDINKHNFNKKIEL